MTPVVRVGTAETKDAALLSWRADGDGKVALLCSNGLGLSSLVWRKLATHFAPTHTVITWDYRGHGRSPVPAHPEELTVALCGRDLWAVADSAGCERAVLLGFSIGTQVDLEAYRLHPGRVLALVPVLGAARSFSSPLLEPLLRVAAEVGMANASTAGQLLRAALRLPGVWAGLRALRVVHPDLGPEELEPYLAGDLRSSFALARDLLSHDASGLLEEIDVPALVVAGERDPFAPLARSRELAAAIPAAELLILREGSHAATVEQAELFALAVEKFLRSHRLA